MPQALDLFGAQIQHQKQEISPVQKSLECG